MLLSIVAGAERQHDGILQRELNKRKQSVGYVAKRTSSEVMRLIDELD